MDASAGVEAGLEQAVALGRATGTRGVLLHQQVRPRERRPDRRARRPARGLRRQDRAAPDRDRRGRVVQRLRRPRPSQGVHSGTARRRSRSRSRTTWPTRSPGGATSSSRPRPRPTTTSSSSTSRARRSPTPSSRPASARASRRASSRRSSSGSAAKGIGLRGAARRDRPLPPLPGRRGRRSQATDKAGADGRGPGRRERPAPRPRLQDDRRPVRRPADLPARAVGHAPLAGPRLEHDPRRGRADRPAAAAPRQGAGADRRAQGRRDRRGRQARRDRDRRHARRRRRSRSRLPPLDFPAPSLVVAIEPVSKGDLDKMGPALAADARGGADGPPRAHRDRRAGPADDGRGPHRGHHRAAQAQVRGGDRDPHAEGPVQGDDPRHDQGPRPLQEADRRPRHVRRRLARARAEPGRRRRVRREGRRRLGAEGLLRRRREGHPRGRGRGRRSPATRCPTSRRRSTTGRSTRSTRTSCRSRSRPRWRSRTASTRRSRRSSSRSWPSRSASPRRTWARSTATSTAGAAGSSAWTRDGGMQVITAHVPAGRAVLVRDRAALAGPRPRHVHARRSTTTRTCRRTSPRRSSRSTARTLEAAGGHGDAATDPQAAEAPSRECPARPS